MKNQIILKPVKSIFIRSNHSFPVDFITRKCKEDKAKVFIYARITVDGDLPKESCLKDKIKAPTGLIKPKKLKVIPSKSK